MSTIQAERTGFFSSDYRLTRDGADLGILDLAPVRSRARFEIAGVMHEIVADGLLRGRFLLKAEARVVAQAQREHLLPIWYRVRAGDRQLLLTERLPGRRFRILHGDRRVGEIRPVHVLARNAIATFEAGLPVTTEVFLLGLALLRWRRRARAARG